MSASLFGIGGTAPINVTGTIVPQSFTATASQTIFNLTAFTYTPGTNSLLVWINGQKQQLTRDFVETSSTAFTLLEGCVAGDYVDVLGIPAVALNSLGNGLSGTATFVAATTVSVTFSTSQADANYKVVLGSQANKTFWYSAKTVSGFILNASAVSSDSVDWAIVR